jgi:hypothetical protein
VSRDDLHRNGSSPATYCVRVLGPLPAGVAESLGYETVRTASGTALICDIADTSALYGLIARLESLGVGLIAVQPVDHDPGDGALRRESGPA